ncbi:MAG: amidase [Gammaproteobacteria bacterium]|nr:amidase [Gammaproteobacteria bacterium]
MKIDGVPFEEAGIARLHAAMFRGQLTAERLVQAYLERILIYDQSGPALNAVVTLNEAALKTARELDGVYDRGQIAGPLHGIPIVVKDCLETTDMPTSFGSKLFAGFRSREDATVIAKLRAAGAIILAKTTLPDWATSWFSYSSRSGTTKNPYDVARDPGGSSSGTGAAVAAGYAAAGLGTDCGGSVRVPSSFCNLVGVRSTPGLVSRHGCNPLVGFQDTIGPMARSVADAARLFNVMVGHDPKDELTYAYSVARAPGSYLNWLIPDALAGLRIGVVRNAFGAADDPNAAPVNEVMTAALGELRAGGATLVDVEIPDLPDWLVRTSLYLVKSKYDIDRFLESLPDAPVRSVEEIVKSKQYHRMLDLLEGIAEGPADPFADPAYYPAYVARESFMKLVVNLMERHRLAALVYPTVRVPPPTRRDCDEGVWGTLTFPTNTLIASQTWMPAMSVPAGLTAAGLPVGMEILARPYDEPTLFRVGYGFEQVVGHRVAPAATPST